MLLRKFLVATTALAITAHADPPKKVVLKDFDIEAIKAAIEHELHSAHPKFPEFYYTQEWLK
jgi:hypothetical protein